MNIMGNVEEIYKTVPQNLLPKEYGGDAGTLQELTGIIENDFTP